MKTKIWAHRGASGAAPENTLAAFDLAAKVGADGIELDVHFTRDREVVVVHDNTLARVTGMNGTVEELTLAQLKKLDFSNHMAAYCGERIPTLQEVLELVKPTGMEINIELKTDCNLGGLGYEIVLDSIHVLHLAFHTQLLFLPVIFILNKLQGRTGYPFINFIRTGCDRHASHAVAAFLISLLRP